MVKPLPRTVFMGTQVEEAFRFLSAGKHRGKVLIQIREENFQMLKSPKMTIWATPRIFFDPRKSYIITGGLGGIGLQLADWMIRKGASKLVLNSRQGVKDGFQKYYLVKWKLFKDIKVVISKEDSSSIEGTKRLLMAADQLGSVGGNKINRFFLLHFYSLHLVE